MIDESIRGGSTKETRYKELDNKRNQEIADQYTISSQEVENNEEDIKQHIQQVKVLA